MNMISHQVISMNFLLESDLACLYLALSVQTTNVYYQYFMVL